MSSVIRLLCVAVVFAVVGAACSSVADDGGTPTTIAASTTTAASSTTSATSPTSTTSAPPTTQDPATPPLQARCGPVAVPVAGQPELPDQELDEDAQSALDGMVDFAGAEAGFLEGYEWFVAERSDAGLVLFGVAFVVPTNDAPPYGYASFSNRDGAWTPTGWGQCRIEVDAAGFGNAGWVLDAEPDPQSTELLVQINERECASGQPPVGREIVPVVTTSDTGVTITVLVESVKGGAACPSNPWFPLVVDLGEPLGDRTLLDGSRIPPLARPWPPTPSSIDSLGSTE